MFFRFVINIFIQSIFFFGNCFVAWAILPQECLDAEMQSNLIKKKNLYTLCIQSGKLSEYELTVIYTRRGRIYAHLGDNTLAIRDYDRAIQMNSKFYAAYFNRGTIYYSLGDHKQAILDFEKAVELRPKKEYAYNNLAWLLITSDDPQYRDIERAFKLIQTAMQLSNFERPEFWDTLAAVYAELGKFDKAIETQEKARKISKDRGEEELSNKFTEVLSDYKLNTKHYLKVSTAPNMNSNWRIKINDIEYMASNWKIKINEIKYR